MISLISRKFPFRTRLAPLLVFCLFGSEARCAVTSRKRKRNDRDANQPSIVNFFRVAGAGRQEPAPVAKVGAVARQQEQVDVPVLPGDLIQCRNELLATLIDGSLRDEFIGEFDRRAVINARFYVISIKKESLLMWAARHNEYRLCQALINLGAVVDASIKGKTALYEAVRAQALEACRCLVTAGAKVDIRHGPMSPVFLAVQKGYREISELLIPRSTGLNDFAARGLTMLMFAVLKEDEDLCRLLLDQGADLSVHNRQGTTALHLAAKKKNVVLARLLVAYAANVRASQVEALFSAFKYPASVRPHETVETVPHLFYRERGTLVEPYVRWLLQNNKEVLGNILSMKDSHGRRPCDYLRIPCLIPQNLVSTRQELARTDLSNSDWARQAGGAADFFWRINR